MKYRMAAALLSLVGVFVSSYLYLYKIGKIGTMACGTGGCETVQTSEWARFLGIEVSLLGLLGYLGLFLVALAGLQPPLVARRGVALLLVAMSGLGVAFAFYLTVLEVFVIHAICYWCVGSAVIIILVLAASLLDLRRTPALESESVAPHPS
ncbi:MAG: vitamin K epoxide reductase family protein [Gemmatimonadetes bacterium]|nr:MAG: vitamin K epoxide reductase family protein [Gemmatimonadota bacterium]